MSNKSQEFIGAGEPSEKIKQEVRDFAVQVAELEEKAQEARKSGRQKEALNLEEQRRRILEEQRQSLRERSRLKEHRL